MDQVLACDLIVRDHRSERYDRAPDGRRVPFNPPRFDFKFEFDIHISVNSPFFNEIDFELTDIRPESPYDEYYQEYERQGYEIQCALMPYTEIPYPVNRYIGMPEFAPFRPAPTVIVGRQAPAPRQAAPMPRQTVPPRAPMPQQNVPPRAAAPQPPRPQQPAPRAPQPPRPQQPAPQRPAGQPAPQQRPAQPATQSRPQQPAAPQRPANQPAPQQRAQQPAAPRTPQQPQQPQRPQQGQPQRPGNGGGRGK